MPLLVQGLAQNQELKIRNQEIQIACNEIMARQGPTSPSSTSALGGGFGRNSRFTPLGAAEDQLTIPAGGRFPDPLRQFPGHPPISSGRSISGGSFAMPGMRRIQRYIAAIEDRNYLITRLVAETAKNYYELASLDKRLRVSGSNDRAATAEPRSRQGQKEAARGTELAVQRFLAEVRKNESQRLIVRQRIIEVENQINFLVGRFPQPVDRESWDFINLDSRILNVGVPAELLLNRRDIRAAEREVAASGLDVLVARARVFSQGSTSPPASATRPSTPSICSIRGP